MLFYFYGSNDKLQFIRDDAEKAEWSVHERTCNLAFPYDPTKVIERGMRFGFVDTSGDLQYFEIRKVKTYEPDSYHEVVAEHIMISELIDDHFAGDHNNYYPQTAAWHLNYLLSYANKISNVGSTSYLGSLWQVGNDYSDQSTKQLIFERMSLYQAVNTIQTEQNVRVVPRITQSGGQITGRYLDLYPIGTSYNGVVLSLDKNLRDMNVMIDDADVITAMYGYGKGGFGFQAVTWEETEDHPAKPYGQYYIEDAAATAAYGRDGRPRFGYYQNEEIKNNRDLLEASWTALKRVSRPKITVDGTVTDLYRMGYADQPIALYDTVYVHLRPINMNYRLIISALTVDLLDPTQTRVTIGDYFDDMVQITRNIGAQADGGVAARYGGGNATGQTNAESQYAALAGISGYTLTAGTIEDHDGNSKNVIMWE